MGKQEDILHRLNLALSEPEAEWEPVRQLILELTEAEKLKPRILDFEFYSDARLEHAEREKTLATKRQAYEEAAQWRDKVHEIQKHVDLRKELELTGSTFRIEHGHLFYFHTGKGKHDRSVLELLESRPFFGGA